MKFSLASIPLAILASTVAAQGPPPPGAQSWGVQPPQQYPVQTQPQQYQVYQQPPPAQYCYCPPQQCPGCIGVTPRKYPQLSDLEVADWIQCIINWLDALNSGSKSDGPACQLYNCLQNTATKYRDGGPLVTIGKVLQPVCTVGSIATDLVGNVANTVLNPFGALTGGLVR
jgi:hypothetical protein